MQYEFEFGDFVRHPEFYDDDMIFVCKNNDEECTVISSHNIRFCVKIKDLDPDFRYGRNHEHQ